MSKMGAGSRGGQASGAEKANGAGEIGDGKADAEAQAEQDDEEDAEAEELS